MKPKPIATLFGGTGFVGHHLANTLAKQGWQVRIVSRRAEQHRELAVTPGITLHSAKIRDVDSITSIVAGSTAVINLIGILNEGSGANFQSVHTELPHYLANIARESGIRRFVQLSALGVGANAPSNYLVSKTEGEEKLRTLACDSFQVSCIRPSVIFGRDDSFINRFASLLNSAPGFVPLACPESRFAPVWVGDVVTTIASVLRATNAPEHVNLCGPSEYTLKELVCLIRDYVRPSLPILGLGDGLSKLQAALLNVAPGKPFTLDNYRSLQKPSVCGAENQLLAYVAKPKHFETVLAQKYAGISHRDKLRQARQQRPPNDF